MDPGEGLKAIQYRNLEEARQVLKRVILEKTSGRDPFEDAGSEPQGLLAVIPEDRLSEEDFYRLFEARKGTLVEVEKIFFSGYGPPAEEDEYMGFVGEQIAYVLKGCRFPIEIRTCPQGARDIHHLEALVAEYQHPLNRSDLAQKLGLEENWDFVDLFDLLAQGRYSAEELDRLIHQGIQ